MEVKFYNSLTGTKESFQPENPKKIKIYSCGPTVYNYAHIGNFRSFIFVDILRRSLKLLGFGLDQTMNITDIDDKIIKNSIELGLSVEEFTEKWTNFFFEDLDTLKIEKVEHYPRATQSIESMTELIEKMQENGLVYEKEGSIYFSIEKFTEYGKLSKIDISGMKTGARYDSDEYTKEDARDFVLWKAPKLEKEKFWETKFGKGRPGWHLECSAMIRQIYNSGIDIHTGGIDLLFPHHENEIAQSRGAYPKEDFVKLWLHCEHLLVEGQKMSKSLGNFYTLRDLIEKGYKPSSIRYLLISAHYRTKLNFSLARIEEAEKAIEKLQNIVDRIILENIQVSDEVPSSYARKAYEEFLEGLADDLNTPRALGVTFEFLREANSALDKGSLSTEDKKDILRYFKKINSLLKILHFEKKETNLDSEVEALIEERQLAKKNKDFAKADLIRSKLNEMGIILEDTKTGITWKKRT
jgi:cysteinyl-tRNA synthetase